MQKMLHQNKLTANMPTVLELERDATRIRRPEVSYTMQRVSEAVRAQQTDAVCALVLAAWTLGGQQPPSGKEQRSPEQEEVQASPTPAPASPQNNGPAALTSGEPVSPDLAESSRAAPALQRLRKFLSALLQFAADGNADAGERVRQLIFNLVSGAVSIEEFQAGVQESANYPLKPAVPGFLRGLLPIVQRDLHARARRAKQTPIQYIRRYEHLILEHSAEGIQVDPLVHPDISLKRRASDPFYDSQSNGAPEEYPPQVKRPSTSVVINPAQYMYPMPSNSGLLDYSHPCLPYHPPPETGFERRDGGISVRDVSTMNATFPERSGGATAALKTDDEWKNINTMLNCILSMVEKTKRALAILQQRGMEPTESTDIKRAASEIMAAAVRQTEERVAEVRRRAEDAVNQVKRQALVELQRAVGAAEAKALELVTERKRTPPPPPGRDLSPNTTQQNCCWNCGRKAQETCSGCNAARYCGAFCQHKDWENHHQVCSGREQKPPGVRASPPANLPKVRAATPAERLPLALNPTERLIPAERLTLSQGLVTGIAKK
ncbi:hypothetical protein ACJJTC_005137 [Scirpophaga incertulas]